MKPSEVVRQSIIEGLKADVVNWDELEKTTDSLHDTKKISNMKATITKESNLAGHSFEGVANLKKSQTRKMSFMSTSKHKISIAPSMEDEEHFLSNEYCYIHGKWNRCKDFPTVTLSVYHPVLRKQVPHFIMEC